MTSEFLAQARKRTAAAFAAANRERRDRLARMLERIAADVRRGRHDEELLTAAERLVWLWTGVAR
jgi:hypothetical protein